MIFSEHIEQVLHDFTILVLLWVDNTEEEIWWNTKAEHSINENFHDLQMHKSLEDFSEECFRFFQYLNVKSLKLELQLSLQVFVFHPSFWVIVKLLPLITILLKNLNVISSLFFHASNSVKHILISVSNAWDEFGREWNYTWQLHLWLMLRFFFNHWLFDCFSLLLLVLDVCMLLSASTFSSLSPIFEIICVVID